MTSYEQAKLLRSELHSEIESDEFFHGTSIGYDEENGGWFINIHSSEPHPMADQHYNDILIKNIVHEKLEPHVNSRNYRPLQGGCQIETCRGFGTLGYFINLPSTGKTNYLLTNQHVLPNGYAFQATNAPGLLIGECSYSVLSDNVDAAIGVLKKDIKIKADVIEVGAISGTHNVTQNDIKNGKYFVQKYGRTTELTTGKITAINYHGTRSDGWMFKDQLFIAPDYVIFSQGGDSGSLVVNAESEAVGLLWGGTGKHSAASPIDDVLNAFGAHLVTA